MYFKGQVVKFQGFHYYVIEGALFDVKGMRSEAPAAASKSTVDGENVCDLEIQNGFAKSEQQLYRERLAL
jgi:hypothetical protein